MSEAVQSGFAEVNNTTLYYEVAGTGRPLVLNHGGLVDHQLWDDQFAAFAQHFKVIRYDIRGFGKSGMITADTKPFAFADDLYALLRFLEIEKAAVLGLSMGGGIAIDFTIQHPELVEALITVGAGLSGFEHEEAPEVQAKFAAMQEAFNKGDIDEAVELSLQVWTDGLHRSATQVDPQVRERVRTMTTHNFTRGDDENIQPQHLEPPAAGRLAEIQVPTLIIVGGQDLDGIFAIAETLKKGIADAREIIIPGTAHHPNLEQPEIFNQVVIEFLENLN